MRLGVLSLALCLFAFPALSEDSAIRFVKLLTGSAVAIRGGQRVPLAVAAPLREHDVIETDANSEIGITFRDNTRVSLGPRTRLEVDRYAFEPAQSQYGLALRLLVGSLQYISGLTEKLSPGSVSSSTPRFVVGVRGTRLLVRAED